MAQGCSYGLLVSVIKGMGPARARAEGAGALTGCSRPALQPGARETGKREGFSVIFPQRKGGKWLGDAGRGVRVQLGCPCPHHPVPPSPRALRAGASVVPHPSPAHNILSVQARKASPRSLPPIRIKLLSAAYGRGMPGVSRHEACT